MRPLLLSLIVVTTLSASQAAQTFTGTISDEICAGDGHARMAMGPTDAECATACVFAHGASYVLVDGTNVYALSDQKRPEAFAGRKVTVTGTLDAAKKAINVTAITAAK